MRQVCVLEIFQLSYASPTSFKIIFTPSPSEFNRSHNTSSGRKKWICVSKNEIASIH